MKKTAIALLTLAAGIMAASCQKEAEPEIKSFMPMTINAVSEGIGIATKTEMAYKYDILWSENDQIYVNDGTANDTFTLSNGEGTTKGTFTQDGEVTFNDEVQAYYPATMVQDGGLVWPAAQTNDQTVPMYSTKTISGSVEEFNFTSLGSVLQIVFNSKQENITLKSIEIIDGSKTMSGAFTVDEDGKAIITATDNAGITIDLGESGVALGNGANYFHIAVPAGNYQNLTLTFTATDGAKCVMKNGKVNIEQNTVGRLTLTGTKFKSVLPFGQGEAEVNAVAGITDNKVKWVQLWEGGPKFAEFNVGAKSATEYGGYYCWGGSIDKDPNGVYKFGTDALTGTNDTATKLWGSSWRMPTQAELEALLNSNNCTVQWTGNNNGTGVNGLLCTGKDAYSSNSVFLPAAGFCRHGNVNGGGDGGNYWSSTTIGSDDACNLQFGSGSQRVSYYSDRVWGYSVRAVLNE